MKNKKSIMFFSSLLVVIFHLWINIFDRTNNLFEVETFLRQTCFIGVDIFFFLSSYSISKKEIKNYKEFILSRFIKVYLPFILFSITALIYFKWDIKTFLLTISGINLFLKGGGSFLWFIPAIMIIYIFLPLYNKFNNKNNKITPVILILIWLFFTLLISKFTTYTKVFIFTNRIPIIIIASLLSKNKILDKLNKKQYLTITIILIIVGYIIQFNLNNITFSYIKDVYYITSIPLTLGLILLINLIKTNKLINILGSVSLEMYCIQMIFGFKIASITFNYIKNPLISNIITIIIIIILSILLNLIINNINKILKIKISN